MNGNTPMRRPRTVRNRPTLDAPHYREIDREKGCPYKHTEYPNLYYAWYSMLSRCYCEHHPEYKTAGAKGVTVCREWQSFGPFVEWAQSNGYTKGLSLVRKDLTKGYDPENCAWYEKSFASRNQSKTALSRDQLLIVKERLAKGDITQAALARELGVAPKVIRAAKYFWERKHINNILTQLTPTQTYDETKKMDCLDRAELQRT